MSFSPRDPTKYVGIFYQNVASYTRQRDPTVNDLFPKENQGKYPIVSMWSNNFDNKLWAMVNIVNNQALWKLLATSSGGPVLQVTTDSGSSPVFPDSSGNLNITGVTNGGVTTVGSSNTVSVQMSSPFNLSSFAFPSGVYSFQNINFISNAGLTQTVTTITADSQWLWVAATNNLTGDASFRAVAFVLGSGPSGSYNTIAVASSNIAFGTSGNNLQITNATGATRNLVVTGLRLF